MQLKSFVSMILVIPIFSCNNKQAAPSTGQSIDTLGRTATTKQIIFDKLLGIWKSEDGSSYERWLKIAENKYETAAYSLKGTDTTWNERGIVYPNNEQWVFENTVTGQNNGLPVRFTSTLLNESHVQFTNPTHDFPTDIHYHLPDENTINAFIVGPNSKGGKDTIPFNFKRIKP
jgi:hypothetical protein